MERAVQRNFYFFNTTPNDVTMMQQHADISMLTSACCNKNIIKYESFSVGLAVWGSCAL